MSTYKEIVTKAVIGKGKKTSKSSYSIETEEVPNTVLGCWVINHRFSGTNNNGNVNVNGSFDVNVWYSYENDSKTAVSTKRLSYSDMLKLRLKENTNTNQEIIVRSLKQPTVTDVKIKDGLVNLDIEKELGVEVVGETKVRIAIEDEEDPWEDIYDDEEITEEISEITDDYIE